ncbi:unnamed protein product [Urochloa decumbens]|uniref:DUF7595 domain-containing protein n=1 Tax=Urochloa decumbens TaxID=240449 RepID=A0ABC8ZXX6_9POAL
MEASSLPLDLLEISARCDPATVARCGATCKLLRRHVTDPAFLRRVRAVSFSNRFLVGLLYHRSYISDRDGNRITRRQPLFAAPKSPSSAAIVARLSGDLAGPSGADPVASRGGLLLLRSGRRHPTSHHVYDPVAGRRSHVLPPSEVASHLHVLMPEDDNEGGGGGVPAFKVLVADRGLRTQTYSSRAGAWGPVVTGTTAAHVPWNYEQVQPSQVMLGGVAHWLYRQGLTGRLYSVLALDIGAGQAAWIEVPEDCHRRRREAITGEAPRELLLASSAGGELALLVWERPLAVCMWTRTMASSSAASSWVRRVVIDRTAILRSVQPACNPLACQRVELLWFAEGSGTVVFHLNAAGTALLNLRTLEVRHIQRSGLEPFEFSPFCVYDLDLASLLPSR